MHKEEKAKFMIYMEPDLLIKIEKLAKKIGINKQRLVNNFIKISYEDAVILDKIGMLGAIMSTRKAIEKIKADYVISESHELFAE